MTEARRTRVLLADDHTMFREGLARLLATYGGLEVVGETSNDEEAIILAQRTRPDVIIMQVQMPFEKAQDSLRRMREILPEPKIVIVTMFENPQMMRGLLKLGASAYVLKSSSSRHLISAVRAAVFDPNSNNMVVGMPLEALEESDDGSGGILSARQLEILLLAARGLSNHQISTSLHIAEGTVKRHLADVYKKMKVRSRSEATRKALRDEWITIMDVTGTDEG
ncbi:MAG TPA: response regulator transcription factor [Rubrobacter sp.]|nr:response regulator transcription factor [Rubrobacter sp.]